MNDNEHEIPQLSKNDIDRCKEVVDEIIEASASVNNDGIYMMLETHKDTMTMAKSSVDSLLTITPSTSELKDMIRVRSIDYLFSKLAIDALNKIIKDREKPKAIDMNALLSIVPKNEGETQEQYARRVSLLISTL